MVRAWKSKGRIPNCVLLHSQIDNLTKKETIVERNDSGEVHIAEDCITWLSPKFGEVTVNLNDVKLIGEFTTAEGPFFDDWFLVFVYADGSWDKISIYATNIELINEHLSKRFNLNNSYWLTNSAQWNSVIVYPNQLRGKELFVLISPDGYKEPKNIIDHIKSAFGIGIYGKDWYMDLSEDAKSLILEKPGK